MRLLFAGRGLQPLPSVSWCFGRFTITCQKFIKKGFFWFPRAGVGTDSVCSRVQFLWACGPLCCNKENAFPRRRVGTRKKDLSLHCGERFRYENCALPCDRHSQRGRWERGKLCLGTHSGMQSIPLCLALLQAFPTKTLGTRKKSVESANPLYSVIFFQHCLHSFWLIKLFFHFFRPIRG